MPRRPSTEAISAVSSPQTNAPAPSTTLRRNGKPAPSKDAPSQPRFSISASAARKRRTASGIFVADIENPVVRADRHRGQRQPLDDAKGKRLENHAVHERARIAFVAVADHILDIARLLADGAPFLPGGETRPAASAQAGLFQRGDELFGRKAGAGFFVRRSEAPPEGGEAFMGEVFIQVQRIELAEMFGGNMRLLFQEGADAGIALAHREPFRLVLRLGLVQQQAAQQVGPEFSGAPQKTARTKMPLQEGARLAGGQVRIVRGRLARQRDFNQRRAMAHAHAADALDGDLAAALARAFAQGVK